LTTENKTCLQDGKLDTTTCGDWGGVYGKEGFVLCNYNGDGRDEKELPQYVTSVHCNGFFPHTIIAATSAS